VTGDPHEPPHWLAALFDLDGTLIDTRPGMRAALEAAFVEVIGTDLGCDRADLSLPLDEMILSADPDAPPALRPLLSAAFRRHYDSGCWKVAHVYQGAEECLRDLGAAGVRAFVVTNKRSSAAGRLLEHFGLARYFEGVVGQPETGQSEPKSELARRCVEIGSLDPARTVVVGDSNHDATMAASWNMEFIAITSGAGPLGPAQADARRLEVRHLSDAADLVLLHPQGGRREP
jgi:phosphoglycolate phosphatase